VPFFLIPFTVVLTENGQLCSKPVNKGIMVQTSLHQDQSKKCLSCLKWSYQLFFCNDKHVCIAVVNLNSVLTLNSKYLTPKFCSCFQEKC